MHEIGVDLNKYSELFMTAPLIQAIKGNDVGAVRQLFEWGVNSWAADERTGMSPLMYAAEVSPEMTCLVLTRDADSNDACSLRSLDDALRVFDSKQRNSITFQLEALDHEGLTVYAHAARAGRIDVLKLCCSRWRLPRIDMSLPKNPLCVAISIHRPDIVHYLLSLGTAKETDVRAVDGLRPIDRLFDHCHSPYKHDMPIVTEEQRGKRAEILRILLEAGHTCPDYQGIAYCVHEPPCRVQYTHLHRAVVLNEVKIVRLLAPHQHSMRACSLSFATVMPDVRDISPLELASTLGYEECAAVLREYTETAEAGAGASAAGAAEAMIEHE